MRVHNVDEGTNNGRPPRDQQGLGHRPRAARGGERTWDMAVEAGMRSRAHRQAAEAGGWRVETKSRWTMIHARRGCGERVRESG